VVLTLGIVIAQAINLGTQHIPGYGWRISLMFAGMPAIVLTLGGIFLPDTPNSLIERGHEDEGKQVQTLLLTHGIMALGTHLFPLNLHAFQSWNGTSGTGGWMQSLGTSYPVRE
jgi:hypothetical protein